MPRPPFGYEKQRGTCDRCNDVVMVPPGVYYRGERLCRGCYLHEARRNYGDEILEPMLDNVDQQLQALLANMGPMVP